MKKTLKKILILTFAVLLAMSIALPLGASAANDLITDFSIVKVKLLIGNALSSAVKIDGNYYIEENGKVLSRSDYTVKAVSGKLQLTDSSGKAVYTNASSITLKQGKATSGKNNYIILSSLGRCYLGDFKYTINSSGYLQLVNHVYMEDYVTGVIPYEIGEGSNIEALKAQAVCARTYAATHKGTNYDVVDSANDQCYKGYNAANVNSKKAVDATKGMLLFCGNELAHVFYTASNGGFIEMPQHIWSAGSYYEPYQICKADPYDTANPNSKKETVLLYKDLTKNTLNTKLDKYIKQLAINKLKTSTYTSKGYDVNLTTDVKLKTVTSVTPTTVRSRSSKNSAQNENHSLKYASLTKCKAGHAASLYTGREGDLDNCNNYSGYTVKLTVSAMTSSGTFKDVTLSLLLDTLEIEPGGGYPVFTDSSLKITTVTESSTAFSFNHVRYGHGVGLSQRGTQQAANQGLTYKQILAFYFPGTSITAGKITAPILKSVTSGTVAPEKPAIKATATCAAVGVNVRGGASSSSAKLGSIDKNGQISITVPNYKTGWHQIWYNNQIAYISSVYFQINATNEKATYVGTTSGAVNLRTYPSTSSSESYIVKELPKGTKVDIIKKNYVSGWHQVLIDGKIGYLSTSYVTVNSSVVAPTAVKLNVSAQTAFIGKTITMKAIPTPTNASGYTETWTSSNPAVATVSKGIVTGVKAGYSKITAKIADGISASYTIYIRLKKPQNFSAVTKGTALQLSWGAVAGATGYDVYRSTAADGEYTLIGSTSTASYSDKKAALGKPFYYKVCAKNAYAKCTSILSTAFKAVNVADMSVLSVSLESPSYVYTGKAITPAVIVKNSAGKAISTSYYTVSYSAGRTKLGTYIVTVTGKTAFKGSITLSFDIVKQAALTAQCVATGVNVRSGPATSYSSLGRANKGETFTVTKLNYAPLWHQIKYNGKTAYICSTYFAIADSSAKAVGYCTTTGNVNLRTYPSTSSSESYVIKEIPKGTKLTLVKKAFKSGWHQVLVDGYLGYVSADYIKIN